MARPTKLTEELIQNAKQYLDTCEDKIDTSDGVPVLKVKLPTVEGLALYLKINRDTIYEWCKVSDEFSDIIENIYNKQAETLINKGLAGNYNSTIAKVLLSKRGYSEKTETDITSKGEQINALDPKAVALAKEFEERLKKEL